MMLMRHKHVQCTNTACRNVNNNNATATRWFGFQIQCIQMYRNEIEARNVYHIIRYFMNNE